MKIRTALLSIGALTAPLLLIGCGRVANLRRRRLQPQHPACPARADALRRRSVLRDDVVHHAAGLRLVGRRQAAAGQLGRDRHLQRVRDCRPRAKASSALTSSTTDSTFAVSWFPADARVLFTADSGGNEINHLYVREADGATRDLTPGDKAKAEFVGWSGRQAALLRHDERARRAGVRSVSVRGEGLRAHAASSRTTLRGSSRPCRRTVAISRSSSRARAPTPICTSLDLDGEEARSRS